MMDKVSDGYEGERERDVQTLSVMHCGEVHCPIRFKTIQLLLARVGKMEVCVTF